MIKTKFFTYFLPHLVCCFIFFDLSSSQDVFSNKDDIFSKWTQSNFDQNFFNEFNDNRFLTLPPFNEFSTVSPFNHQQQNWNFRVRVQNSDNKFKFTPDEITSHQKSFNPPRVGTWSNVGQKGLGVPNYNSKFKNVGTSVGGIGGLGIVGFVLYRLCRKKKKDDDIEEEVQSVSEDFSQSDVVIEIPEDDESTQDDKNSTESKDERRRNKSVSK